MERDKLKDNRFDRSYRDYPKYAFHETEWKVLSNNERELLNKDKINDSRIRGEIITLCEMWNVHLIDKADISFLLEPKYFKKEKGGEFQNLLSFYEQIESLYDEESL